MAIKIDFTEDKPGQLDFVEDDPTSNVLNVIRQAVGQVPAVQVGQFLTEEVLPRSEAVRAEALRQGVTSPAGLVGGAAQPEVVQQLIEPTTTIGEAVTAPALEKIGIKDIVPLEKPISLNALLTPPSLGVEAIKRPAATLGLVAEAITDPLNIAFGVAGLTKATGKAAAIPIKKSILKILRKQTPEAVESIQLAVNAGLTSKELTPLTKLLTKQPNLPIKEVNTFITKALARRAPAKGVLPAVGGKLPRQAIKEQSKGIAKQLESKFTQSPSIQATNEGITDLVSRMTKAIRQAKPIRVKQEKLFTAERAKRFARAQEIGRETTGEAGFLRELGQLKGELPKAKFESIRNIFSEENITNLFETIKTHPGLEWTDTLAARQGLRKLLSPVGGSVPTEGELGLLKGIFGKDFVSAITSKRTLIEQLKTLVPEIAGVPRALMSSFDFSMPFRQGIFFATRPKQFFNAFKPMFKSFFSEKQFLGTMEDIVKRPTFKLMRDSKLALTRLDAPLAKQEEFFMSNLAERIPIGIGKVVRASNRAAVTFLNKLRADVFDSILTNAQKTGVDVTNPKFLNDLSKFINNATGRGTLPGLERAMVPLANVLFSPRLIASRVNLLNPLFYASLEPTVRKEALKSLAGTTALMSTVLGLSSMAGAEVETDSRSTDFGKIKIGNTRFDIMGGFQQFIVLYSRLLSGKTKTTSTKQVRELGDPKTFKPQTRLSILEKFIQNKTAPLISLGLTLLRGKTPVGEDVSLSREISERFTPFVLQDLFDLVEERGLLGIPFSIPAFFGVGIQTFDVSKAGRAKKRLTEQSRTNEVLELLGLR